MDDDDERIADLEEQRTIRENMRLRIAAGMVQLDRHYPGWEEHIDKTLLDLENSAACIVGQTRRWQEQITSYTKQTAQTGSVVAINLESDDFDAGRRFPPDLGMDLAERDMSSSYSAKELYSWLTEEWILAINARRQIRP